MVRREVFNAVGGFDEAFAVEFNDVDFCLRVSEAGYYNLCLPHVRLYHHEALTRGDPLASPDSATGTTGKFGYSALVGGAASRMTPAGTGT